MSNVLFVKVNDRPLEQAVSVQMYTTFLQAYQKANPSDTLTEIDLFKENIPYYGNDALTGLNKVSQQVPLTEAEEKMVKVMDKYMDQFLAADKIVIAFPTWNLTAPAPLLTYISYLAQAGKTFKYTAEGPVGLATDKKILLLNARGGNYSLESTQLMEFAVKPTKSIFSGLMGIPVEEVIIEGHQQHSNRSSEIIKSGLEKTKKAAASF